MYGKRFIYIFLLAAVIVLSAAMAEPADVIILGDVRLKPVDDIVGMVRESLDSEPSVYLPKDIKGALNQIVIKERAKVVIVLGGETINDALALPESISVVYGLLLKPLSSKRQNITGVYMTTPVGEYLSLLERYFTDIRRLGIIVEPESRTIALHGDSPISVTLSRAGNSYEFIKSLENMRANIDALLLLPEKNLLTSTAVEEMYRHSFAGKVPVLGLSEKHVKMGSLFALVFDESGMGKQIGELTNRVLARGHANNIPSVPPDKFNLYINTETARSMKVYLPSEVLRKAKAVYP